MANASKTPHISEVSFRFDVPQITALNQAVSPDFNIFGVPWIFSIKKIDRNSEQWLAIFLNCANKDKSPNWSYTVSWEIKQEKPSLSPEQEAAPVELFVRQLSAESNNIKIISVRKDLVEPTKDEPEVTKSESDDEKMDIEYDTKTIITPHESIPDVRKWDCDEVYTYFMAKAPQFAQLLKENQIDGDALLLIKREDVLNRFSLKLGPALRLYTHIVELQYKNNNPILAWNEF